MKNKNSRLQREHTGLLMIDVQTRLIKLVENSTEVLCSIQKVIKGFKLLNIPIIVSEQYPQGLGETVPGLKGFFEENHPYYSKTTFSCLQDSVLKKVILQKPVDQWVLIGIEAHVCVLQTAKDLLACGKEVVILNDAIASRSIYDFSTAIAELRDCGARISSMETVLFEILNDSKDPAFKAISQLIK